MRSSAARAAVIALLAGGASVLAAGPPARAADFDPVRATARQWHEELGLTAEQARRFEAAATGRARAVEPIREQMRAGLLRLRVLVARGASDSDLQAALMELTRLKDSLQRENAAYEAELARFLSPVQRAKLLVLMQAARLEADRPAFNSRS